VIRASEVAHTRSADAYRAADGLCRQQDHQPRLRHPPRRQV